MKRISDRIYRKMVKALGKVLAQDNIPMPQGGAPPEPDDAAALNVLLWGDPQISCLSPLRAARVTAACRDLAPLKGKYDALLLLGDITEYGAKCEYKMMLQLVQSVADKFTTVLAVPGNHDIRLRFYQRQRRRFQAFCRSLPGGRCAEGKRYNFAADVGGYRFILMGADRTKFEASYFSRAQLEWLQGELDAADKNKPVFVCNHQPLKHTHGLPLTWLGHGKWRGSIGLQSEKLRRVLQQRPNTVYITGHLHYGVSRYNFEDDGNLLMVSVPTVGVLNHGDNDSLSQALVMRVYPDRIIFQGRVHSEGRYTDDGIVNARFEFPLKTD